MKGTSEEMTPKEAMAQLMAQCRHRKLKGLAADDGAAKSQLSSYLMAHAIGHDRKFWDIAKSLDAATRDIDPNWSTDRESTKPTSTVIAEVEANQNLVDKFMELSKLTFRANDVRRGVGLKKAAMAIAECTVKIENGAQVSKGKGKLPGVGKSSGAKIDEILETGTLAAIAEMEALTA